MRRRDFSGRSVETEVSPWFVDRWSPRAFRSEPIPERYLHMLFEAARFAPSSYNEQPWTFVYAVTDTDRAKLLATLVESNQRWARDAPALMYLIARKHFADGGAPNRVAMFDAGSAWLSLALQARLLGLYAHAMAGFDSAKAYAVLGVAPTEVEVIAAIAVGYRANPADLSPDDPRRDERPNDRKPLAEVAQALGVFTA